MRLAVALGLGHLVEPLPPGALLDIVLVDRLAGEGLDHREHAAVGEVAVVRDRQHVAAGLVLVGLPSTSTGRAGCRCPAASWW